MGIEQTQTVQSSGIPTGNNSVSSTENTTGNLNGKSAIVIDPSRKGIKDFIAGNNILSKKESEACICGCFTVALLVAVVAIAAVVFTAVAVTVATSFAIEAFGVAPVAIAIGVGVSIAALALLIHQAAKKCIA